MNVFDSSALLQQNVIFVSEIVNLLSTSITFSYRNMSSVSSGILLRSKDPNKIKPNAIHNCENHFNGSIIYGMGYDEHTLKTTS